MDQQLRFILDVWEPISPLHVKRMFGGHGVFKDGLMFAIFIRGILYLKADKVSIEDFSKRSLRPFSYERSGKHGDIKTVELSYVEAPLDIYDDSDMALDWARKAIGAALRNKNKVAV